MSIGLCLQGHTAQYFYVPAIFAFCGHKKELGRQLAFAFYKDGGTMLVVGLLAASVGLVLGLRFSVITFIVLTVAILVIFAMSVLGGSSPLVVAFHILVTLASVQISYLFGSLLAAHFPVRAMNPSDYAQTRYLRGLSARSVTR